MGLLVPLGGDWAHELRILPLETCMTVPIMEAEVSMWKAILHRIEIVPFCPNLGISCSSLTGIVVAFATFFAPLTCCADPPPIRRKHDDPVII